ncbi:MAG TPA: protease complex subunit PrcB family protein [Allosphingosinicella sp.]
MRFIVAGLAGILLASASLAAQPQARAPRAELEREAAAVLGPAVPAQVRAARSAVLVRGPVSFPYMERRADGSYRKQRPAFAAAVGTAGGWIRLTERGREPLEPAAGRALDRLLAGRALWTEPAPEAGCTDPGGALVLARHGGRQRVSAFPCGFAGLAGEAARIVLAGRIDDWSLVPASERPAGLPLARFDERIQSSFRHMSGVHEQRLLAIRSAAEWQGQWRRITARQGEPPRLPPVDFRREMLLIAAMGPKPSGGYRVAIDKVVEQSGELLAFVRFIEPGRRCGAIAAVTSPVDVVRLPASPKNLRWVVERETADCP